MAALAQPAPDRRAELQHPAPHRFVGDVEPYFGQQFFDIAVAQGEAEIEPDRVDNLESFYWALRLALVSGQNECASLGL